MLSTRRRNLKLLGIIYSYLNLIITSWPDENILVSLSSWKPQWLRLRGVACDVPATLALVGAAGSQRSMTGTERLEPYAATSCIRDRSHCPGIRRLNIPEFIILHSLHFLHVLFCTCITLRVQARTVVSCRSRHRQSIARARRQVLRCRHSILKVSCKQPIPRPRYCAETSSQAGKAGTKE